MNDIIEIRARAAKATPGPWRTGKHDNIDDWKILYNDKGNWLAEVYGDGDKDSGEGDAEFISHARVDVPVLCDEVETLRAREKRMREALEFYARGTHANIQGAEAYLTITGASSTAVTKVPFGTLAREALKDTSNE